MKGTISKLFNYYTLKNDLASSNLFIVAVGRTDHRPLSLGSWYKLPFDFGVILNCHVN